jgi:hypothetical protein
MAIADERIDGIHRELKLLSGTKEVKSGEWDTMKGLLTNLEDSSFKTSVIWFVRPDGVYYTVEGGLEKKKLSDRPYFPGLMAGKEVKGYLVISKATGKRSAVIAVPVKEKDNVVGAIGVSLDLEEMSRILDGKMGLPEDMVFYALNQEGQSSLHRNTSLLFAFPSDVGSKTLKEATGEMLSKPQGVVTYEFHGEKKIFFKRSLVTNWVFALGVVIGGRATAARDELPSIILSELQRDITARLNKMDAGLYDASIGLSDKELGGPEAKAVLQMLCSLTPHAVDCVTVDKKGIIVNVAPEQYSKAVGADISSQGHVISLLGKKDPELSSVFRAVEGFDAAVVVWPVLDKNKELVGSVNIVIRPDIFLSEVITPVIHGLPVDIFVLQKDGRVIYDPDQDEIGRIVFSDPMYQPFPELLSLAAVMVKEKSGSGSYTFMSKSTKKPVKKDAVWDTVGLHGTEWRLVVVQEAKPSI